MTGSVLLTSQQEVRKGLYIRTGSIEETLFFYALHEVTEEVSEEVINVAFLGLILVLSLLCWGC